MSGALTKTFSVFAVRAVYELVLVVEVLSVLLEYAPQVE